MLTIIKKFKINRKIFFNLPELGTSRLPQAQPVGEFEIDTKMADLQRRFEATENPTVLKDLQDEVNELVRSNPEARGLLSLQSEIAEKIQSLNA